MDGQASREKERQKHSDRDTGADDQAEPACSPCDLRCYDTPRCWTRNLRGKGTGVVCRAMRL